MTAVQVLALVHVGSALLFVAGYVGTNLLTEVARRTEEEATMRAAVGFSGLFDRRLLIPFGTITSIAGLALTALNGYSWVTPWVAISIVLYLVIVADGILVWGRRGGRIEVALGSGRLDEARAQLRDRRFVAAARAENAALAVIVALMIVRPA